MSQLKAGIGYIINLEEKQVDFDSLSGWHQNDKLACQFNSYNHVIWRVSRGATGVGGPMPRAIWQPRTFTFVFWVKGKLGC